MNENIMTFENLYSITEELNYKENIITELKQENEQLKKNNLELNHQVGNLDAYYLEYKRENKELKEQIESMKCCGNCKFNGCHMNYNRRTECKQDYKHWELKESD